MQFALGWFFGGVAVFAVMFMGPLDRVTVERNACKTQLAQFKPAN